MSSVYVVIENGEIYKHVYTTFDSAVAAVKEKHAEEIAEQISNGYLNCSEIDVPEAVTGTTYLYVEKGIHIYIYKLSSTPWSTRKIN